jgi:hypothetical protein
MKDHARFPKTLKPKRCEGSPSAGGAPTSPTCATPNQDLVDASSVPGSTESPGTSHPSPQSHGLGATGGTQRGEASSVPQPEEIPQQRSRVTESLWDNLDFIQAEFHVGRFVTATIDTEVDRDNIKAPEDYIGTN